MGITGGGLTAIVEGSGTDVVLFLHGLGCCKENFHATIADPRLQGLKRIAVDLPGHGNSKQLGLGCCGMEAMADLVRKSLLEHASTGTALHIVAHSMGGAPGLLVAENPPFPVSSFLNVEGNL